MIYYSQETNGFYDDSINGYLIPSDKVQISQELHELLLNEQSSGKIIQAGQGGIPEAVAIPLPTTEQCEMLVRNERNKKALCAIDTKSKYEREQSSIARSVNVLNPMLESEYILVLQYLQELFELPEQLGFPWGGHEDPLCPWPTKPDCVCDTSIA